MSISRLLIAVCALAFVVGCSDDNDIENLVPEVPLEPTTISGVAATGEALVGATVEVIDASGAIVDVPIDATGSDGSYQVQVPGSVALPVIIRITPVGGDPLLTIVPPLGDGETETTANVNPVTNLVSDTVLADADATDPAALAGALANVDTTTIEETGNTIVQNVLGNSVTYDSFASDADFVAKSDDPDATASAADAILDTLARQAEEAGEDLADTLSSLAGQEEAPSLLDDPAFQVELVSELLEGGTDAEAVEASLDAIGALPEDAGDTDVFRTVIEVVPVIIAAVEANSEELGDDPELLAVAVDAAVEIVAETVDEKDNRFAADDATLVDLLTSPVLQDTVTDVVETSITPVLAAFAGSDDAGAAVEGLSQVAGDIADQAATVISGFEFSDQSADVSDLVAGFVEESVAPDTPLTLDDLADVVSGEQSVIPDLGDVNDLQGDLQDFVTENPDVIDTPLDQIVDEVPPGTWGESRWGQFNWG